MNDQSIETYTVLFFAGPQAASQKIGCSCGILLSVFLKTILPRTAGFVKGV